MAPPTILTNKAEEWVECASRLLLDTPESLRSASDWTGRAKLSSKNTKEEILEMCEQRGVECSGRKADVIKALVSSFLGPDVPEQGVRMCHPGIAMGYDTEMRNPAWCAYRLNPEEQRATDNDRKSFELDPALKAAGIQQTSPQSYTNTGFDKGHLAPSLAMSFQRDELKKLKRSPWKSSYYASNIAPQHDKMNQRCWQTLEEALHKYAEELPKSVPGVYVVSGVGYWNRDEPRRWDADGECHLRCLCGDECGCRNCTDTYVTVPTFYWKAACDPDSRSSFAVIAENDPESGSLEGGKAGWPPSAFKTYSVQNLQTFFGINLNFPDECNPSEAVDLVPKWNTGNGAPLVPSDSKNGKLSISLMKLGGKRVMYKEQVWLHFESAFGPSSDFHDAFTLEPPPPSSADTPGWKADCNSLIAQQLPKLKSCSQSGSNIALKFSQPSKGGTFLFTLSLDAPAGPLAHNNWTARVAGKGIPEMVAMGRGFELLPSPDWKPEQPSHGSQGGFYHYWPFYAAASLLVFLFCVGCIRRFWCTHTVRERELEAALERGRATLRQANAELQRRGVPASRGIEMWDLRQTRQ
ncbi:unnamed protein product [Durusdinium trenchii]|uniref:SAP domain-containing protein n=2 Tax=Durusdinium trenchii TaxID=1381693 RepID=A0ABP0N429_9DINO